MKTKLTGLVAAGLWAAVAVVPINAQTKNWGIGIHGAYFDSGTLAENGNAQLGLDNTGGIGGNLEAWFASGWLGFRMDASYTSSPWALNFDNDLEDDFDLDFDDEQAELDAFGDLNVWAADLDLMVRILSPKAGRWFAPFISVGGGMVRWDHPQVDFEGDELNIEMPVVDAFIEGDSQAEPAVTGSIGTDIFWNDNVAFRFEAKDYWNPSSPYERLDAVINPLDDDFEDESGHHDGANNMVYSVGLSFMFGGGGVEEPGFIAVAPEPAPPPPPAPPATEQVAMCVVDATGRLQTVSALRKLDDGQIAVLQNGRPIAFNQAYPTINPRYIRGAQWYVASRPLVLVLDEPGTRAADDSDRNLGPKDKVEFVSFGSAQKMGSNDLVFVGTIDNTPAYAPASRLAGVRSELEAKMRTTTDLGRILEDDAFADRFVNEVGTFYLAVEPGQNECLFQPMSSTRTVRRTRG